MFDDLIRYYSTDICFRLQSNLSCIENETDKASIIESIDKSKEILEEESKVSCSRVSLLFSFFETYLSRILDLRNMQIFFIMRLWVVRNTILRVDYIYFRTMKKFSGTFKSVELTKIKSLLKFYLMSN